MTPARAPDWAKESARLWNAAEQAENRKDSRVARENIVALPHELTLEQNRSLLHRFVEENYIRRGMAAQVDIHGADEKGDSRNIHAHILLTTRPLTRNGFKAQKPQSWNDKATLAQWRENWAQCVNQALERHGFKDRIDSRTLQAQGIFREATRHLGPAVTAMERRGQSTRAGDHNRAVERGNRALSWLEQQRATVEEALAAEQTRQRADPSRLKVAEFRENMAAQRRPTLPQPPPTPARQAGPAFNWEAPPQGPPESPAQEQAQAERRAALVEEFRQAQEKARKQAREWGRDDGPELER